jgi:hypothetical protein
MNEGTRSGKGTIRLLGISAERPTNGLYLLPLQAIHSQCRFCKLKMLYMFKTFVSLLSGHASQYADLFPEPICVKF